MNAVPHIRLDRRQFYLFEGLGINSLISGHESKKSLEVYQHLSLESVDKRYQDAVQSVWFSARFVYRVFHKTNAFNRLNDNHFGSNRLP
jgi:hypothetical protein